MCVTGCIRDAFSKTILFASHSQNFIHVTLELVRIKSFDTRDFVRQKGNLRIKFTYQLEGRELKKKKKNYDRYYIFLKTYIQNNADHIFYFIIIFISHIYSDIIYIYPTLI